MTVQDISEKMSTKDGAPVWTKGVTHKTWLEDFENYLITKSLALVLDKANKPAEPEEPLDIARSVASLQARVLGKAGLTPEERVELAGYAGIAGF